MSITTLPAYDVMASRLLFHKHAELIAAVEALEAMGVLSYRGTWNATTNSPALASGVGTKGYYYVVSATGTTTIDGVSDWVVGDWIIFNGTAWQKADHTDSVSSVFGRTGVVVAGTNDYTWAQINKVTSSIADITTRSHTALTDIGTRTHAQIDARLSAIVKTIGVTGSSADYECDGTDDQVQFASAIADATAGDTIRILAGTYNFSAKLTLNKSLIFEGVDRTLSIINIDGAFTGVDVTAEGCVFRYLSFFNDTATGVTDGSKSLLHLKADNQVVECCSFDWYQSWSTAIFANCRFHNITRNILVAHHGVLISWTDLVGYIGQPPQGLLITSNIFGDFAGGRYCNRGVYFTNVQGSDFLIWQNRMLASDYAVWDNDSTSKQISIFANSFSSIGTTISLKGTKNVNINANIWASAVYTPVNAIVLENVEVVNIDSNNFWTATTDFVQIKGTSTKVNITDNIGNGTPTAGVTESGAADNTTLMGNVSLGAVTLVGANSNNKDAGTTPLDVEVTDATKGIILRTAEGDRVRVTATRIEAGVFTLSFNAIV